jgi:hypothetical protein
VGDAEEPWEGFPPACLYPVQAVLEMNGTVMIERITAAENTTIASLNRHGKRFVQCLVFSKIDMVSPSSIAAKE